MSRGEQGGVFLVSTGSRDDGGRFSGIGLTAKKWIASTRRAITGFPRRQQLSWKQREPRSALNQILWQEARGEHVPNAEERKQDLLEEWLGYQEGKVGTWNHDYPGEPTAEGWGRIDELLEPAPPAYSSAVRNRIVPRYINEDGEFGESRERILDRIQQMDGVGYENGRAVAYRTDAGIRQDLFQAELLGYGYDISQEDINALMAYAEDLKETEGAGEPEKAGDVVAYEQRRIREVLSKIEGFAGDMLQEWEIPSYLNEAHKFAGDRPDLVDRIVQEYGAMPYSSLETATDGEVRKHLLRTVIREDYDPHISDEAVNELILYAENLRAHADIDVEPERPDNEDLSHTAQSDGGTERVSADPSMQQPYTDYPSGEIRDVALPGRYTADGYEIVNTFTTTAYNTYQKVDTGNAFEYRKNGIPVTPQSYAGASAHRLPDGGV